MNDNETKNETRMSEWNGAITAYSIERVNAATALLEKVYEERQDYSDL